MKLKPIVAEQINYGEPFQTAKHAIATAALAVAALKHVVRGHSSYPNPRVVVQTNGIWLGQAAQPEIDTVVEELAAGLEAMETGKLVIEVSFKGPNTIAARQYALSKPSPVVTDVFATQVSAFYKLLQSISRIGWSRKIHSVSVYPIAGLGPDLGNPSFVPLNPSVGTELPLFHPETWEAPFQGIVKVFNDSAS